MTSLRISFPLGPTSLLGIVYIVEVTWLFNVLPTQMSLVLILAILIKIIFIIMIMLGIKVALKRPYDH